MSKITLNVDKKLYVIRSEAGYSCLGFDNAVRDAAAIATLLNRQDLMPIEFEYASVSGYEKYLRALSAWESSLLSKKTWYIPGTPPNVINILEAYRSNKRLIRLFFGDGQTGRDYCEEWDVVGTIGRSAGSMKTPLLMADSSEGGGAISTNAIVRMMDVASNRELYRHPEYKVPQIRIEAGSDPELPQYPFVAYRDDDLVARFKTAFDAHEYRAFMVGDIAAKQEDLRMALRAA